MAIKELFYDQRPVALLNPRASQRIDPRFKFTRDSAATVVGSNGLITHVGANQPRIDYDPTTLDPRGLLLEDAKQNYFLNSTNFAGGDWVQEGMTVSSNTSETLAPDGTNTATKLASGTASNRIYSFSGGVVEQQTFSIFVKPVAGTQHFEITPIGSMFGLLDGYGSPWNLGVDFVSKTIYRRYTASSAAPDYTQRQDYTFAAHINGWFRISWHYNQGATSPIFSYFQIDIPPVASTPPGYTYGPVYVWGAQREPGVASSYFPTTGISATRAADLLSIEAPLPATGSVYIDARAIRAAETDTLISLKNNDDEKINLSYESNAATYNSLALIASYTGTSKISLPLPVPTTARERNIITWGANNYQYTTDSSRYATSLSSSVPDNLTQLSIGHDAVDTTKAFNGYINAVYLYNGEITPAVAEALVRGELDPIDADTYSPEGADGSLALVINTQGATASGDKTFTLPPESDSDNNDIVITWGDGTESRLEDAEAELGASGLTHTYPAAGIYPVWVEGKLENLRFNNSAYAPDLLEIAEWGTSADGNDVFLSPSTMNSAFYGCSQMDFSTSARTTNLPDTSAVTNWYRAFRDCESITGTFPSFNLTAATTLQEAWQGCSSMTSFIDAGNQTQNVINFSSAWYDCSSLENFPEINTAAGTNFSFAWRGCFSLENFPEINTAAGTSFNSAWLNCSSLTSFPKINTAAGTDFGSAWRNCSSLDNIVNAGESTSFPSINTSLGTNFASAWLNCSSLTNFPEINTAAGTNFAAAWRGCSNLTSFPKINTDAGTTFASTWRSCSSLPDFPAGFFDSWNPASVDNECFYNTWLNCVSLTPASVVNILNSIAASGQPAPIGTGTNDKKITIDWNTSLPGDPATDASLAIGTLQSRGWQIYLNGALIQ